MNGHVHRSLSTGGHVPPRESVSPVIALLKLNNSHIIQIPYPPFTQRLQCVKGPEKPRETEVTYVLRFCSF